MRCFVRDRREPRLHGNASADQPPGREWRIPNSGLKICVAQPMLGRSRCLAPAPPLPLPRYREDGAKVVWSARAGDQTGSLDLATLQ